MLKSGYFSAVFAQYSKLAEAFRLVQFPYGSPFRKPTDGLKQPSVGFLFSQNTLCPLFSKSATWATVYSYIQPLLLRANKYFTAVSYSF